MKILLVSDYFQPKIGYTKVQVSKHLSEMGHTVKVLTSDRYFPFHNYEATTKKILGERIRIIGTHKENGFLVERKPILLEAFTRVFIPDLKASIRAFNPDQVIVVGISTFTCFQVAQLKSELGFKLIIADSHLPSEFNSGNNIFKNIFYDIFKLLFTPTISKAADKVIAIQDKTVDIIKNVYGITKPIFVVPNGTDTKIFRFSKKYNETIRKELNIPQKSNVLIYTGKIIQQKGVDLLFTSFSRLIKKYKNIHLILVGSGPEDYISTCKQKVSKKELNNIHFIGFLDQNELFKYYSAADIAVWPLQESLAMNDAAACKLPFIANNTMGDKTRISNDNALLYKKNNIKDLTKQIELLLKNPILRKKMGENGRKLMVEKLSWKKIAEQYI